MKEKEILHIYTRVSSEDQTKGMSLDEQKSKGIKVSKDLDMDYMVWNEGGKSSYTDDLNNRPVLLNLMDGFKDGSVKNIYVKDFDRLSRKKVGWYLILRDISQYGIKVYVGEGNKYNIDDEYDNLMLTIMSGITQFDNEQRRKRLLSNKIRKFNEGYYVLSITPYGYQKYEVGFGKKLRIHTEHSKVIKHIFNLFSKGKTINQIQSDLLDKGIKSPTGLHEWGHQCIREILQNTLYIGETSYRDSKSGEVYKNKCVPIIDKKVWSLVQKRFQYYSNETQQIRRQKNSYLLTGLLFCGVCETIMRGRKNPKKYENIYYCGTKELNKKRKEKKCCDTKMNKSVNIDRLDDLVWSEMIDTIRNSKVLREMEKTTILKVEGDRGEDLIKKQMKEIKKEKRLFKKQLTEQTRKQTKLWKFYVNDSFKDDKEFHKLLKVSQEKISDLEEKIEDTKVMIDQLSQSNNWVDWLKIYKDRVNGWRKIKDIKVKKKILQDYVQKISVIYNKEERIHQVEIKLRLHLFNDNLVINSDGVRDESGKLLKLRDYKVLRGEKSKSMVLSKTKVGRKKLLSSDKVLTPDLVGKNSSVINTPTTKKLYHY